MFAKILIANRGEIACRIARTAQRLGIHTVGIYSAADRDAQHTRCCDTAWYVGAAAASESYLNIDNILHVARAAGAQAVHPGYGFLSENAAFAQACTEAGLVFIGPPAAAIRLMGAKNHAKQLMQQAGVPVLDGYQGDDQSAAALQQAADDCGYPLLIKAVSGGGGKGMRVVETPAAFAAALQAVKREAQAAFADARVMLEKYLPRARHVEVQIFADQHGNIVHLFERDCSLQRRHQKVIEEAPAPGLSQQTRQSLYQAAINAAGAIDYIGAGTVEFLLDPAQQFYFMEMNTRLQVEHAVTEMLSQQDLVEWQLRVAAGESLPKCQSEIHRHGHAMEARIYAESPANGFLPSSGVIQIYRPPRECATIRIDSGIAAGDQVSPYYDPMLAKLIVVAENRHAARTRLAQALRAFDLSGVDNNLSFLHALCHLPQFAGGTLDTGLHTELIAEQSADLLADLPPPPPAWLAAALFALLQPADRPADSPWCAADYHPGWRMNLAAEQTITLGWQQQTRILRFRRSRAATYPYAAQPLHWVDAHDMRPVALTPVADAQYQIQLDEQQFACRLYRTPSDSAASDSSGVYVRLDANRWQFTVVNPLRVETRSAADDNSLNAPMPGSVVAVSVSRGQRVTAGQALVIIEAMKMEHTIKASYAGVVEQIFFQPGEPVRQGAPLLQLKADLPETTLPQPPQPV